MIAVVLTTLGIRASDSLKSKGDLSNAGCPEDMVFVTSPTGGFCIDIYEASAGKKCPYRNDFDIDKTRVNLKTKNCEPASISGALPWVFVSRDQAALACAKAGKRLATPKEWYLAALGTPDKDRAWDASDCQVNSNWESQPGACGSGVNCVSSAGAYDMVGNVWEWVDGNVTDAVYQGVKLPGDGYISALGIDALPGETIDAGDIDYNQDYFWLNENGIRAIARGGNWINKEEAGQYSAYIEVRPDFIGSGIGFRCVK